MLPAPIILTVDDSQLIRRVVFRALRSYKCRVIEAEDGLAGLKSIEQHKPNLVILDHNMPNMDGFEMLKLVRANPKIKDTRVIMLTANSSPEFVRATISLGVRDFMVKPFDDAQLISKVLRQVQITRV
jgi:chemosensory pili system protein ChpA (sensor histidine kinase/response regulator)